MLTRSVIKKFVAYRNDNTNKIDTKLVYVWIGEDNKAYAVNRKNGNFECLTPVNESFRVHKTHKYAEWIDYVIVSEYDDLMRLER